MNPEDDYDFKIVLIGDTDVGKSCLLRQVVRLPFVEGHTPSKGVDFKRRTVEIDDKLIKLQIWDTPGQEKYRSILPRYYRGVNGFIVVYDVTNQESFNNVKYWLQEIHRTVGNDVNKILVGNKCDLRTTKEVDYTTAKVFANHEGIPFLETSAKIAINVDQILMTLADEIQIRLEQVTAASDVKPNVKIDGRTSVNQNRRGCCYCC